MTQRKPRRASARSERRQRDRALAKLADGKERLARLEPGGAPERPIPVESASQVEPHARTLTCARCDGPLRVDEHAAEIVDGARLRVARATCSRCGARRDVWFSLGAGGLN